jgi:hypothetical protein
MRHTVLMALVVAAAGVVVAAAQFVPDSTFRPPIEKPAFLPQKGPVVLLDEAHFNYHTSAGRYLPFAEQLRRDGYIVGTLYGRDPAGRKHTRHCQCSERGSPAWREPAESVGVHAPRGRSGARLGLRWRRVAADR